MKDCRDLVPHLNRIIGQIEALKHTLEEEHDCIKAVQLTLSATNSFKSFKAKLVEAYIMKEILGEGGKISRSADFEQIMKLLKS